MAGAGVAGAGVEGAGVAVNPPGQSETTTQGAATTGPPPRPYLGLQPSSISTQVLLLLILLIMFLLLYLLLLLRLLLLLLPLLLNRPTRSASPPWAARAGPRPSPHPTPGTSSLPPRYSGLSRLLRSDRIFLKLEGLLRLNSRLEA